MIWRPVFNVFLLAAYCALTAGTAHSKPATWSKAATWFPLKNSNYWEFVSEDTTNVVLIRGAGSRMQVEHLFGPSTRMFQRGNNLYVRYKGGISSLALFARALNSPWKVRFSKALCDRYEAQWVATNGAVITPAGTFLDCRVLSLQRLSADECDGSFQEMYIYFAQGVGPVLVDRSDEFRLLLASANVSGAVISREFSRPPLRDDVTLEVFGDIFKNDGYYGSCKVCAYPTRMPFSLTFSNSLFQPLCVGKRVDVKLIDSFGRVMKSWSDEPGFDGIIFPDVLAPGQTIRWDGSIELSDRLGHLLSGDMQVSATVSADLLPPYAVDCSKKWPDSGPIVSAAEGAISVVIRWRYVGGVIMQSLR